MIDGVVDWAGLRIGVAEGICRRCARRLRRDIQTPPPGWRPARATPPAARLTSRLTEMLAPGVALAQSRAATPALEAAPRDVASRAAHGAAADAARIALSSVQAP